MVKDTDVREPIKSTSDEETAISVDRKTPEDARRWLSYIYVTGFLGIVILVLVLSYSRGFVTQDVKDLLVTTSGILSGPLGFIIGYYFKSREG